MKNILCLFFIAFIALSAPSCSRKSGCPSDSAQSQVDRHGEYKKSKTKSGLLPAKAYKRKAKSDRQQTKSAKPAPAEEESEEE